MIQKINDFEYNSYLETINNFLKTINDLNDENLIEKYEKTLKEYEKNGFNPLNFNTLYDAINILKLNEKFNFLKQSLPLPKVEEISFNNFKSFGEKLQKVKIKPITLIYAPNSVGKSSFLHSIILLHYVAKYHLEKNNLSVAKLDIFGDEVDLGGFKNYIHKHEIDRKITFIININDYRLPFLLAKENEVNIQKYFNFYNFLNNLDKKLIFFFVSLIKKEIEEYNLNIVDLINSINENIQNINSIENLETEFYFILKKTILEMLLENKNFDDEFIEKFKNKLKTKYIKYKEIFKNPKSLTIKYIIGLNKHESIYKIGDEVFYEYNSKEEINDEIKNILKKFDAIVYSKNIQYIGPLRFFPERNYTLNDINEKSSYSSKEMWRLLSQRKTLRENLNDFLSNKDKLKSNYNIEINKEKVLFKDLRTKTLVTHKDIGLGISQVLPILISSLFARNKTIVIEQPELHLHPAIQAELGDEIIKGYKRGNNYFFIETHSEYLLLRIMKRMRYTNKKKNEDSLLNISSDDISLLYIDCDDVKTYILELELSDDGKLLDRWPGGFFEEGFKERFS